MSNQSTDWLSIREAAVVLGVSDLTVRRRIKDGRIAHRLIDGKYYVNLGKPASTPKLGAGHHVDHIDQSDADCSLINQATDHGTEPERLVPAVRETNGRSNGRGGPYETVPYEGVPHQSVPFGRAPHDGSVPDAPAAALDLDALLSEHTRLAEQAGRVAALEGQLHDLSRRRRELEELTLTLSNRNGWLESKLEEREQHIKLLADHQKRPWWKRLFRPRAGA